MFPLRMPVEYNRFRQAAVLQRDTLSDRTARDLQIDLELENFFADQAKRVCWG